MAAEVTRPDAVKATVPDKDPALAAKGSATPAPIPAEERPSKEKDLEKAQAMLAGKDPEYVELIDGFKGSRKLVKVVKDGKSLQVHPDTLEAHLAAGWKLAADEVSLDEAGDRPAYVEAREPKPVKARADKAK